MPDPTKPNALPEFPSEPRKGVLNALVTEGNRIASIDATATARLFRYEAEVRQAETQQNAEEMQRIANNMRLERDTFLTQQAEALERQSGRIIALTQALEARKSRLEDIKRREQLSQETDVEMQEIMNGIDALTDLSKTQEQIRVEIKTIQNETRAQIDAILARQKTPMGAVEGFVGNVKEWGEKLSSFFADMSPGTLRFLATLASWFKFTGAVEYLTDHANAADIRERMQEAFKKSNSAFTSVEIRKGKGDSDRLAARKLHQTYLRGLGDQASQASTDDFLDTWIPKRIEQFLQANKDLQAGHEYTIDDLLRVTPTATQEPGQSGPETARIQADSLSWMQGLPEAEKKLLRSIPDDGTWMKREEGGKKLAYKIGADGRLYRQEMVNDEPKVEVFRINGQKWINILQDVGFQATDDTQRKDNQTVYLQAFLRGGDAAWVKNLPAEGWSATISAKDRKLVVRKNKADLALDPLSSTWVPLGRTQKQIEDFHGAGVRYTIGINGSLMRKVNEDNKEREIDTEKFDQYFFYEFKTYEGPRSAEIMRKDKVYALAFAAALKEAGLSLSSYDVERETGTDIAEKIIAALGNDGWDTLGFDIEDDHLEVKSEGWFDAMTGDLTVMGKGWVTQLRENPSSAVERLVRYLNEEFDKQAQEMQEPPKNALRTIRDHFRNAFPERAQEAPTPTPNPTQLPEAPTPPQPPPASAVAAPSP